MADKRCTMEKSSRIGVIAVSLSLLLTGCSNPFDHMPDLTEEQSALVAEYAAGLLVKHDKHAGRLASEEEIAAADAREAALLASVAPPAQEEAEAEKQDTVSEPEPLQEKPFENIAQFCGIEDFQIVYTGHLICDTYPPTGEDEIVFEMDATPGSQLLVLQFDAANLTGEDKELDMLTQKIRFGISVNDGYMENALSTLLLNDLSAYRDTISAGEHAELVLVREIPTQEAAEINTISLSLKSASGNATTLLE